MFNLEQAMAEWREKMIRGGINSPKLLDELESHLREDVERAARAGANEQWAFDTAVRRIGPAGALKAEFRKVAMKKWNQPLVIVAWAAFVVSFFLPAYADGRGWQCAIMQKVFWDGMLRGEWGSIHYELLTLANILMLCSPFILLRQGGDDAMKWFRGVTLAAAVLVWWFVALLLHDGGGRDLKIGCYVWGTSFILLHVSTWLHSTEKVRYA